MNIGNKRTVNAIAWIVFAAACVCVVSLQILLFFNSGAFWRDEISSIELAKMSSFASIFSLLERDSFPAMFVSILHGWIKAGFGGTEAGLRSFGLIAILSLMGAIIWNSRAVLKSVPLLSLALLMFNPAVFYYGSSLRAYGLAAAFVIILFGCISRVMEEATPARVAAAFIFAVLNVQSTYQNPCLVVSVFVSGVAVCLISGQRRKAGLLAGIGALSILTILPYLPVIKSVGQWDKVQRIPFYKIEYFFYGLYAMFGSGGYLIMVIWLNLLFFAVLFAVWCFVGRKPDEKKVPSLSMYSALAILTSCFAMVLFAFRAERWTCVWQYLPFAALLASALEAIFSKGVRYVGLKVLLSLVLIAFSLPSLWEASHTRRTNFDLVAARLVDSSKQGDLILVDPFWNGISFKYHYKGTTQWETLPFIGKSEIDDPFRAVILSEREPQRALEQVIDAISKTLKNDGRLWIAEGRMPAGEIGEEILPAPHPLYGWYSDYYVSSWSANMWSYIRLHAAKIQNVEVPVGERVNHFEDVSLYVAEGWRQ